MALLVNTALPAKKKVVKRRCGDKEAPRYVGLGILQIGRICRLKSRTALYGRRSGSILE